MSAKKKNVRKDFRDAVFKRDNYTCQGCGYKPPKGATVEDHLDAHHITDRHDMPHGGYAPKNGISLCKTMKNCHLKAERKEEGFTPENLYAKIGSSFEEAWDQSEELLGD
jgi:5-methylcytosine-specific restriction endonuclease McrA